VSVRPSAVALLPTALACTGSVTSRVEPSTSGEPATSGGESRPTGATCATGPASGGWCPDRRDRSAGLRVRARSRVGGADAARTPEASMEQGRGRPREPRVRAPGHLDTVDRRQPRAGRDVERALLRAVPGRWRHPLAVAALERVYPLSYSRSRLTGTARDLARIHAVATADAGALVDTVDAVLRRDRARSRLHGPLWSRNGTRQRASSCSKWRHASTRSSAGSSGSSRPYGCSARTRTSPAPPTGCR